jgi:glycine oxidase
MNTDNLSIAIIGGGVIGLSIACALAKAGIKPITVFDKNAAPTPHSTASLAAAGMLCPQLELEPSEEWLLPLMQEANALWPRAAADFTAQGLDIDYRPQGTLMVAVDADDQRRLMRHFTFCQNINKNMQIIDKEQLLSKEPLLSPYSRQAIYSPEDRQVDPVRLMQALTKTALNQGVNIHHCIEIIDIIIENNKVTGVQTAHHTYPTDGIILCGGAALIGYPNLLKHLPSLPLRPVKGQMLCLEMPPLPKPPLTHVIWGRDVYLAPKSDGRLLVGATVEEQGFDTSVTAGGMFRLLEAARRILPNIDEWRITASWAGLRPGSLDDAPILGDTPVGGLYLATGHYRNGILLSLLTGEIMRRYVMGEDTTPYHPFSMRRFTEIL